MILLRWLFATLSSFALFAATLEKPWFQTSLLGLEVGPTGAQFGYSSSNDLRYASLFDGREIVQRTVLANADYLVIWARDGDYAYYNSSFLQKCPGLGERDPLRETVDEAKKRHLPIIAYCVVQQRGHFLKAHPEWEMRGFDAKPLGRFCLNSGYLEAMKQIVAEQLAYGIDGFHIDMLDQGFGKPYGCWCDSCRTAFEKEFGHPLPKEVKWDAAWNDLLEFRYRSSERFEKALAAHIKSLNPRATVDFNYHGNPPFSFEVGQRPVQHANNGDFVTGETGAWGFSALTVGLNAEFYRAATPGKPYQIAMQRGVRMYHDQTTRPLLDIRWELLALLSHGAFVTMVDKTAYDGSLDPVAYNRVGRAFADAQARAKNFGGVPVQDVGIYFSSRSRDWIGRDTPGKYFQGFQGAQKAFVYEHIPWGILFDENATLATLQQFPVVLLPNASILSPAEIALFRDFVRGGGDLILTGHSGTHSALGEPLTNSPLSELVGAKLAGLLDSLDNWIRFGVSSDLESVLRGEARPDWSFLVKGPATIWQPTSAQAIGDLLRPARTPRQLEGKEGTDWPMSAGDRVGPAVLLNRVGQGRVLTFACSPDFATASEHHIVEARKLLANAVRYLHEHPRLKITAPSTVEAVVTDDPAKRLFRVHLLAYNSPPQTTHATERPYVLPNPIEDAPLYRARIELPQKIKAARAYNPSTTLERHGKRVDLLVNDVHDLITISY